MSNNSSVILLINTQLPENIGAAARAMMNFGLKELRLVAPREQFPNKRAYDLAGHAAEIIDNAKVFNTTQEAVADLERVYAATARNREMVKPVYNPLAASQKIHTEALKTGIMFGPERTGLTNEDVTIADAIITIPTSTEFSSLNVAQSVVVIAYQLLEAQAQATSTTPTKSDFASKAELQAFFNNLEKKLDAVDFWKVPEKKQKMWLNLQNIFTRANLTEQEVRTLYGVIAELSK